MVAGDRRYVGVPKRSKIKVEVFSHRTRGVDIAGFNVFVSMPFLASEAQMDLAVAVE